MTTPGDFHGVQICTGLGAGNFGDDLMSAAFWSHIRPSVRLVVEALDNYRHMVDYPTQHTYENWLDGVDLGSYGLPGYCVGGTLAARWGLDFPLRALTTRLTPFLERALPVHFLGIGVDMIQVPEGRELFQEALIEARSWTVRSQRCQNALTDLGVPSERIAVGADWAWLYDSPAKNASWGADEWRDLGIEPDRPFVVANLVNEIWADNAELKMSIARALDRLAKEGYQIAFFCNEIRPGAYYDHEAAVATRGYMKEPSILARSETYTLDQVLGLLCHATATISQRYHFTVESILAGTVPISIARGDKMIELLDDLELPCATTIDQFDAEVFVRDAFETLRDTQPIRKQLQAKRFELRERAKQNLAFLPELEADGGRP